MSGERIPRYRPSYLPSPPVKEEGKRAGRREGDRLYNKHRRDREADRFYKSLEWKRVRARVLEYSPLCTKCKDKGILTLATDVHHVEALRKNWERRIDVSNLEAICKPCHNRERHKEKGKG
jgi:5-methylcytosine-specific restriction enzyme A